MKTKLALLTAFCISPFLLFSQVFINKSSFLDYPEFYTIKTSSVQLFSPNNDYLAIQEGNDNIIIIDSNNKIICKYSWNTMINEIKDSDTIFIKGWSSDSRYLWFASHYPMHLSYIARIDLANKETKYFSIFKNNTIYEFTIDFDKSILFYSDFLPSYSNDDYEINKDTIYNLWSLDLENNIINKINSTIGRSFNPKIISSGIIEFVINNKKVEYKY